MTRIRFVVVLALLASTAALVAQAPPPVTPLTTANSTGTGPLDRLYFRSIGPATPSGRVNDFAVLESDPTILYEAFRCPRCGKHG